jgi:uncharacterized protein Veg
LAGRRKRVFTDDDIALIKQYALNNCHNKTIATALDIPNASLNRHFGKKIALWKAQGKVKLREHQMKLAEKNPSMAIFLGKNTLNQTDKHGIKADVTVSLASSIHEAMKGK